MPITTERFVYSILAALLLALGAGCYQTLPSDWNRSLPGTYEGTLGEFREVLIFRTNNTFLHEVYHLDNQLLQESGRWRVELGSYEIALDKLTRFYDPVDNAFKKDGTSTIGAKFSPLPNGQSFDKISDSTEFHFCLVRK